MGNEKCRHGWELEHGVTVAHCPGCGFAFAAEHENTDGTGYSCPCCEPVKLGGVPESDMRDIIVDALRQQMMAEAHAMCSAPEKPRIPEWGETADEAIAAYHARRGTK